MMPQIALQLYTLRQELEQNFSGTMEKIADLGFTQIETAFFPAHISLQKAAQTFRDLGLTVCSAHTEIPLGAEEKPVLEMMAAFDCQTMIWHGWPQSDAYGSVEGTKRLAERYNQANRVAQANGLRFGLHNHWWEFERVESQYRYQILLEEIDLTIFFEFDAYWGSVAGVDPVAVIRELGPRVSLLHIKDGPAVRDEPMVAIGQGTLDFPAIAAAAAENVQFMVIELDECATDMLTAVRESRQYLLDNQLAQ